MNFGEEEQWWFQDLEKKVFGPYKRIDMKTWYREGHLQSNLLVSTDPTEGFFKIHEFYPDIHRCFQKAPLDPKHNKSSVGTSQVSSSRRGPPPMPHQMQQSEEPHWYFIDGGDQRQGPFTNAEMYQWYQQGYFDPSLQVCDNNLPYDKFGWKTIAEYYPDFARVPPFKANPVIKQTIQFPERVPAPPKFENLTKIYPSERSKKLVALKLTDIFGNPV